jgi:hypothetical protein
VADRHGRFAVAWHDERWQPIDDESSTRTERLLVMTGRLGSPKRSLSTVYSSTAGTFSGYDLTLDSRGRALVTFIERRAFPTGAPARWSVVRVDRRGNVTALGSFTAEYYEATSVLATRRSGAIVAARADDRIVVSTLPAGGSALTPPNALVDPTGDVCCGYGPELRATGHDRAMVLWGDRREDRAHSQSVERIRELTIGPSGERIGRARTVRGWTGHELSSYDLRGGREAITTVTYGRGGFGCFASFGPAGHLGPRVRLIPSHRSYRPDVVIGASGELFAVVGAHDRQRDRSVAPADTVYAGWVGAHGVRPAHRLAHGKYVQEWRAFAGVEPNTGVVTWFDGYRLHAASLSKARGVRRVRSTSSDFLGEYDAVLVDRRRLLVVIAETKDGPVRVRVLRF